MNVIGYGISLVDVNELNRINLQQRRCLELRCLTAGERKLARMRLKQVQYLASRLAAKKALHQVLTRNGRQPIPWLEIEIQRLATGQPVVVLYGKTLKVATRFGIQQWLLSLSHTSAYAAASAIALGGGIKSGHSLPLSTEK